MSDTAHEPVRALVPPRSPQELREWTVEDYGRMARRFGADDDRAALERRALSDLQIADAVKRETPPPLPPNVDTIRHQRETRQERVDARAAAVGAEIQRGQVQVVSRKDPLLHGKTMPDDKWSFAKGRSARIMSGATQHSDPKIATSTCEMPALALRLYTIYACLSVARSLEKSAMRFRVRDNPFAGFNAKDRVRILRRLVEDVCDESSGRLGPWWVPK